MPFQQPNSSIIRQYHFRGKAYTFPVEATMSSESGGGQLWITVSDGYALKTLCDESLQTQHALDYVRLANGSWLVRSTITLMATASSLLSGTLTLRDPTGAVLCVAIIIEPTLFIDDSPIFFGKTRLGGSTTTLLTIQQQGAITPINLRIDSTRAFTIANTKMAFVSTNGLSITPSFEGARVLVNYRPIKAGHHNAHLVINTPYDTKTISLIGQTSGLLGWLSELAVPTLFTSVRTLFVLPALRQSQLVRVLIFLTILGLTWGSYTFLSRSTNTVDLSVLVKHPTQATPLLPLPVKSVRDAAQRKPIKQPVPDAVVQANVSQPTQEKPLDHVRSMPIAFAKTKQITKVKLSLIAQMKDERVTQAKIPTKSVNDVSELELELNTPISHRGRH